MVKKSGKAEKTDRQARIDAIRRKERGADKRRGFAIVGVCILLAVVIVGAAAYKPVSDWWDQRAYNDTALADIGVPASDCQDVTTKPADGNQQHEATGTPITYPDAPPAFGAHWNDANSPASFSRKFYAAADRPALESLVHNLEHGYTIMWYDDTAAADATTMDEIRAIARKFAGSTNQRNKFIAAPYTDEDEATNGTSAFPDDAHVALSHWSSGGAGQTDPAKQVGAWQYCSGPSGAALESFMETYPYVDSPEPGAA